jgi:hypothetical protein
MTAKPMESSFKRYAEPAVGPKPLKNGFSQEKPALKCTIKDQNVPYGMGSTERFSQKVFCLELVVTRAHFASLVATTHYRTASGSDRIPPRSLEPTTHYRTVSGIE